MNLGATPVDQTTLVGQVRLNAGDTQYTDTATPGVGDFVLFSDDEITACLTTGSQSAARATGLLIQQLALRYSLTGISVKTNDQAVDTTKRGATLLALAQSWFDQADAEDKRENAMTVVPGPVGWSDQFATAPIWHERERWGLPGTPDGNVFAGLF